MDPRGLKKIISDLKKLDRMLESTQSQLERAKEDGNKKHQNRQKSKVVTK